MMKEQQEFDYKRRERLAKDIGREAVEQILGPLPPPPDDEERAMIVEE